MKRSVLSVVCLGMVAIAVWLFWPRAAQVQFSAQPVVPARPSAEGRANPVMASPIGTQQAERSDDALVERVAALEATVAKLQAALDGISVEQASADRQALFTAEEGYLKADEYFEAGKFAIAGEGYLAFLQKHPGHADARDIMKKARDAFWRAGYKDKSLWVQEEMMKSFPAHRAQDIMEQAKLEKDAGRLDSAIAHAGEAAKLATNPEEALWNKLYWAWYVQLRDGNQAGINAIQQVQQQITGSGVTNPKLAEKAQQHLVEFQNQLAATGR